MTKSQTDGLLSIAAGILADARLAYPEVRGLDRDLTRLTLLVKNRGLGVFTLDLPKLDQSLVSGLESGSLDSKGTLRYSKKYPVPRLFAGLYMLIFDKDLCLLQEADPTAIAFLRQLYCLGKKLAVPCSRKRELQAVKEYVDVERELPRPTLSWESDELGVVGVRNSVHLCDPLGHHLPLYPECNNSGPARDNIFLARCQQVADIVASELGTFCPDCVIDAREQDFRGSGLGHGPGAVAERSGRYFDKYQFTSWSPKLEKLFPFSRMGRMPNDDFFVKRHEAPSRLICVPKTAKGPRLIAAEPSEQMFCQKLTGSWLREKVHESWIGSFINFRRQELSGEMVLRASLDRSLSTIDLSSASDRLTCWIVERIFRRNPSLLNALHAHRTRWIYIPQLEEYIKLKKFASQGTDVTFPVQSIVFLCAALAVSVKGDITIDNILKVRGKVRVFGDDIIIPTHGYAAITRLLSRMQLKVNEEKSFSSGNFRESCGTDAFRGYDVTPCKVRTVIADSPASCQAVIDQTNNLFYKGYWNASQQLEHRLRRGSRKRFTVVGRGAGASGLGSFSLNLVYAELQSGLSQIRAESIRSDFRRFQRLYDDRGLTRLLGKVRWNSLLHRAEVRIETIRSRTKNEPFNKGYSGLLHRAISPGIPNLSFTTVGASGVPERPRVENCARWEPLMNLFHER